MVQALQCADALDSHNTHSSYRPHDVCSLAFEIRAGEIAGRHQLSFEEAKNQHSVGEHPFGGVCLLDDRATDLSKSILQM